MIAIHGSFLRFIPAGAGNTGRGSPDATPRPVYPRRCGEHAADIAVRGGDAGLSPQVRGTPKTAASVGNENRFIPAGAGNTRFSFLACGCVAVYPRRCGEHAGHSRNSRPHRRFIPAGAGNTRLLYRPRNSRSGLSPQVRGTLEQVTADMRVTRFIPAGAGNTGGLERHQIEKNGLSPQVRGTLQV